MIQVGDKLPEATFTLMTSESKSNPTTNELFPGKKVVLFAVPGAFTPTCSEAHLPGFIVKADEQVPYEHVDAVLDALKQSKVKFIYLLSDQKTVEE